MNRLSRPILYQALLAAALCSNGTAATESAEPVSGISVVFVEPQKFTDARRADFKPNSESLLDAIAQFMREMGEQTLPPELDLAIRVTDIDLAGDFEPWHGPQSDQVRFTNQLYPPRIVLEFRVIGERGRIVASGKRALTDLDYQRRTFYPMDDYLRYEKDLLRRWFQEEFVKLKQLQKE
jgi:Protein of unknown function (DUF3016)